MIENCFFAFRLCFLTKQFKPILSILFVAFFPQNHNACHKAVKFVIIMIIYINRIIEIRYVKMIMKKQLT